MTLFRHDTGPLVQYHEQTLIIEDLNPESRLRWRMSRWEMFKFGVLGIVAAVRG
jgi:hypothetical protein